MAPTLLVARNAPPACATARKLNNNTPLCKVASFVLPAYLTEGNLNIETLVYMVASTAPLPTRQMAS
eukprot:7444077-Alexandrium_andersonii.AAC.1